MLWKLLAMIQVITSCLGVLLTQTILPEDGTMNWMGLPIDGLFNGPESDFIW